MASGEKSEIQHVIASDDIENTFSCQPCECKGERCIAVGFCKNCNEYLCQRCYDGHAISFEHMLIDKKQITELLRENTTTESEIIHQQCEQHSDKKIEYHCPTHSFLGCHLCSFQHQKTCKDVLCVQEVSSSSIEKANEVNKKLETFVLKYTELQKDIEHNLQTVTSNHTDAITAVQLFKQQMIDSIYKLEKELVDKADKVKKEQNDELNKLSERVKILSENVQKMSASIERLQKGEHRNALYIELLLNKDKILIQEEQAKAIECEKQVRQLKFNRNSELAKMLKCPWGLGSLVANIEKVEHVRDTNSKTKSCVNACTITGFVLLTDDKLILIDNNNSKTVKLIDIMQNEILADLQLPSKLWKICKIDETQVAGTLPNERKVVFLRIDPTLAFAMDREITIKGVPRGIDYFDGKLVVSYSDPNKVEIMDMQGTVKNTFDKDSNGQNLFYNPYHLAINPSNGLIYVSNFSSHSVICMQFDGSVKATYKDTELQYPRHISFDSIGMVYVVGGGPNHVHQITETCKKVKVLLTSANGLRSPHSIYYQENVGRLIIGQEANEIKLYQVS